jgi:hypothetical protein
MLSLIYSFCTYWSTEWYPLKKKKDTFASQLYMIPFHKVRLLPAQYNTVIRLSLELLPILPTKTYFAHLSNCIILYIVRQWLVVCTWELLIMAPSRETSLCYWIKIMKLGSNCCWFCSMLSTGWGYWLTNYLEIWGGFVQVPLLFEFTLSVVALHALTEFP